MTQHIRIALSLAAACSTAVVLSAQTPSQPQTPPRPQTTQPAPRAETAHPSAVTVVGCLKSEKDVPGLAPNIAERAGMGEDFILTNARIGSASGSTSGTGSTAGAATGTGAATGSTAGMGAGKTGLMYKVTGLSKDELEKHLNHQVELQGRVDESTMSTAGRTGTTPDPAGTGSTSARGSSGPDTKVKEFEATALKMVSATCPGSTR